MPSFDDKKDLRIVVTLGTGTFNSAGDNQITLKGFRTSIDIDKAGGMQMSTLRAKIYGVRADDMAAVTTLQWKPGTRIANTVKVFAIAGSTETLIFGGNIVNAWGDYQSMPDVFLYIQAQAAFYAQIVPVAPRSYKGAVRVADAMADIAKSMVLTFENAGVDVTLADVYLSNTDLEQARELAKMANVDLYVDDEILAITPRQGSRQVDTIPLISRETGLVGYPTFDGIGVTFMTLFNPGITFGGRVRLDTDLPQAAGEWVVTSVAHRLETWRAGGPWYSVIRGNANGLAITGR